MTWPIRPRRGLTADDLAQVETETMDRLHAMVPRLSREHWQAGLTWYRDARRQAVDLAVDSGLSVDAVAGIIAALSPRCNWENNLDDARLLIVDGIDNGFFAFESSVAKAAWIMNGETPDNTLGGRKVRSFWRNITDPDGSLDVTLDSHMAAMLDLPGDYRYLERKGIYDAISNGFRTVAAEHGIMPHQLQAALWISQREGKVTG